LKLKKNYKTDRQTDGQTNHFHKIFLGWAWFEIFLYRCVSRKRREHKEVEEKRQVFFIQDCQEKGENIIAKVHRRIITLQVNEGSQRLGYPVVLHIMPDAAEADKSGHQGGQDVQEGHDKHITRK
jgi:hypothetical protein